MKVLISGGTSNIGYSLAKRLSLKGHKVFISVHTSKQINFVKNKIKTDNLNIEVLKLDVKNKVDREKIKEINPDCLVVHAGIGYGGSVLEMDMNVVRENYEVNVFSNFSLIKEFYELKKNSNKKSKIFVTSSLAGYIPLPFLGSYSSTKASITSLCKTLKYELKYLNPNITITLIEPGSYHTGFNQIMIDNKEIYSYKDSKISKNINTINRIHRNVFRLVEKDDYSDLVKKIVKEIEKENPKFRIRRPILQSVFIKIYLIFFG